MRKSCPVMPRLIGQDFRIQDRKSTRLNSSHVSTSYAVFCLKKKIVYRPALIHKSLISYSHFLCVETCIVMRLSSSQETKSTLNRSFIDLTYFMTCFALRQQM